MRIMRGIGLVLAACLSCFTVPAMADTIESGFSQIRYMTAMSEPQGVAMARMELTLAQWRTGSESSSTILKSSMRSESNHLVMVSVVPVGVPDWDSALAV